MSEYSNTTPESKYGITDKASHVFASATYANVITTTAGPNTVANFMALYVGGTGNVVVQILNNDSHITFADVTAGSILPVYVTEIANSVGGTTATNIIGLNW